MPRSARLSPDHRPWTLPRIAELVPGRSEYGNTWRCVSGEGDTPGSRRSRLSRRETDNQSEPIEACGTGKRCRDRAAVFAERVGPPHRRTSDRCVLERQMKGGRIARCAPRGRRSRRAVHRSSGDPEPESPSITSSARRSANSEDEGARSRPNEPRCTPVSVTLLESGPATRESPDEIGDGRLSEAPRSTDDAVGALLFAPVCARMVNAVRPATPAPGKCAGPSHPIGSVRYTRGPVFPWPEFRSGTNRCRSQSSCRRCG